MSSSTQCNDIQKKGENDRELGRLKALKGKVSVDKLQNIYDCYGYRSNEFYEAIKNLINYLQYQYMGRLDEDCFNDCYVRILESFDYWEKEKSNIVSWIHLVVRNKISSFCYTYTKKQKEGYEYNDAITSSDESDVLPVKDTIRTYIVSMKRLKMTTNNVESLIDSLYYLQDHPLYKSTFWDKESEEFLCQKKKKQLNISIL